MVVRWAPFAARRRPCPLAMTAKGQGTMSSTYSFSSAPKPVSARKKYRDPGETGTAMYRDLKETCITWDKRVHRGNTYSMFTQNAIREALAANEQEPEPRHHRKRKQEKSPFDMPLPVPERIPVDLTRHLVAAEKPIEVAVVEAQTDEFLPEPPAEQYQPQKTGKDVQTQVEDGELFHFDKEVEPILDVLVMKTLEQSIMEVEEEHELARMSEFKDTWHKRQEVMMAEWVTQVNQEWVRWHEKEHIVALKREQKKREARVLLKLQAMECARQNLRGLVPNAVKDLQELAFPDKRGMAIDRIFLPQLLAKAQQEVRTVIQSQHMVDELIKGVARNKMAVRSATLQAERDATRAMDQQRLEEMQIRRGKIRITVEGASGERIPVGPIQISTQDSMTEVQDRVYAWLQENEPQVAAAWPWGIAMCINLEPVQDTKALFEAKPGQISMVPKPEPPQQEEEEAAEGEEVPLEAEEES